MVPNPEQLRLYHLRTVTILYYLLNTFKFKKKAKVSKVRSVVNRTLWALSIKFRV